jgi:ABC-2 type transport system permease protein
VVDAYERQRRRQQALIERLRYLSPAMLMQDALNDLAGTGTTRYRHFSAEVDRFHAAWRAHFTPLILGRTRLQSLEAVPMFQYREEHTLAVATRVMSSVAGLSVPAVILAWLGMRRLRRYPVTAG